MEPKEEIMRDIEAQEATQKKELEEITTLLEGSESGSIVNAPEIINYDLEFDLHNPYMPTKQENIGMFDVGGDATDYEPIEEVDNVQISDVVVDRENSRMLKVYQ